MCRFRQRTYLLGFVPPQVCWDKLCNYLELEPRKVAIREDRFTPRPGEVADRVDENTVGVVGILGSTYTGHYEYVAGLDAALGE